MTRLLILTPGELTRDPRARRAAAAARDRGLEVVGLSGPGGPPVPLEDVRVVRVGGEGLGAALRSAGLGGMRRSRPLVREARGLFRLARLAASTVRLVAAGRRLGAFDIVHANDLDTLPAAHLLARRPGTRLVYDAHELYTSQEPDPPRLHGAVALRLERRLARRAHAVTTVGESIARELDRRLRLPRPAIVVLSSPERYEGELPERAGGGPLRAVYQGAMGPGRALDDLLEAASAAGEDVELTVRVAGADLVRLRSDVAARGLSGRVHVVDPVAPDRLVPALLGFDVGLVINRPVTANDEHVLPNKLFEYLMAGLAVAVPRLPGMTPLVEGEGVGVTFEPARPDLLGAALAGLARDRDALAAMQARARRVALERYNAATQAEVLAATWQG